MIKKVFFQNNKGNRLAGILHLPDKEGKFPAIIRIHGFQSNKDGKSSVAFADEFKDDYVYLRFDIFAHGESEGNFEDLTPSQEIDDVKAAIGFVSKLDQVNPEKIGLIGSSLGGMVSIYTAANNPNVKAAVFVCPVSDFKECYAKSKYKPEEWEGKGEIFFEDYDTGKTKRLKYNYYEDGSKYDLYQEAEKIKIPTLIIHGDADESVPIEQSHELVKHLNNPHLEVISGADHRFSQPEHFKAMIKKTTQFFKENL